MNFDSARNIQLQVKIRLSFLLACENIRFPSLFAPGDVSRETSLAAKSVEKRMFSQASFLQFEKKYKRANSNFCYGCFSRGLMMVCCLTVPKE